MVYWSEYLDEVIREQFRSGVFDNLEKINHCVHNVDFTSRDSVNLMLKEFTETIRCVTDPLFRNRVDLKTDRQNRLLS